MVCISTLTKILISYGSHAIMHGKAGLVDLVGWGLPVEAHNAMSSSVTTQNPNSKNLDW